MSTYNHKEIEKKWQKFWANNKTFQASDNSKKPKFYVLDMFPLKDLNESFYLMKYHPY